MADVVIDGLAAPLLSAESTEDVSAILRDEGRAGERFVVKGAGTKLDWGMRPTHLDAVIDVSAMTGVIEHSPGDLVVRARAGTRLADIQSVLAAHGQRLAIDEVVAGSSIGGIVSTALSGPLRQRFGGVRDLLIGLTVVRADGVITRAGGRVPKNVAGYDLCKLFTGSYGTLGVITEVIFRIHPLAVTTRYIDARFAGFDHAVDALRRLRRAQLMPAAVELNDESGDVIEVVVALEGVEETLGSQTEEVRRLLGSSHETTEQPAWWSVLPGRTTLKVTTPPGETLKLMGEIRIDLATIGAGATLRASGGLGIIHVGLDDALEVDRLRRVVDSVRELATRRGGHAVVLRAPQDAKDAVDVWGQIPALRLMKAVKDNFDPSHRLAPGRFVGGI